jgi:hypothetical protein
VTTSNPDDPRLTPRDAAESEEQDVSERMAAERGRPREEARRDEDDPREDDGWSQPESSAQKGAVSDDG